MSDAKIKVEGISGAIIFVALMLFIAKVLHNSNYYLGVELIEILLVVFFIIIFIGLVRYIHWMLSLIIALCLSSIMGLIIYPPIGIICGFILLIFLIIIIIDWLYSWEEW